MLGAVLLARTMRRNRAMESQLRQVSGAFAELLDERFGEWGLTRSERDVAWFTIKGLSIAEIARLRGTSEGTVKAHSNAIYRKAGVSGRTQLLSLFIEDLMGERRRPAGPSRRPDRSVAPSGATCAGARFGLAGRGHRRRQRRAAGGRGSERRYVMEKFEIGDLVVLASGSMRMAVEAVDEARVACVWCHEGEIGRDAFDARLLKKWEYREEEQAGARRGRRQAVARRARGRRQAVSRRRGGDERPPRGKPGWDGKPREKKFFRKDG